jgi:hypothetical protein
MRPKTIEHLQHFVSRVCSIVTTSMNRSFDEKISREHFVVLVEEINPDGIWGSHPYNKDLLSFFVLEHVISIHQEEVLDPTNPEHAAMMKDFEQRTGRKAQGDLVKPRKETSLNVLTEKPIPAPGAGDATFVDIDSLDQLAEETRRSFEQYNSFSQP